MCLPPGMGFDNNIAFSVFPRNGSVYMEFYFFNNYKQWFLWFSSTGHGLICISKHIVDLQETGAHLETSKGSSESWLLWLLSVHVPTSQGRSQPSCDFCLLQLCSEIVTFPSQDNVTSNRLPTTPMCILSGFLITSLDILELYYNFLYIFPK